MSGRLTVLLFMFLLVLAHQAVGQTNPLNRPVNLWLNDVKLGYAMSETERVASFYFSYKTGLIRTDSIVDVHSRRQPVRRVLKSWFRDRLTWKAVNNHIILLPASRPASADRGPALRTGRVTDNYTGKPLPDVTILAVNNNKAALSDSGGAFVLPQSACDSVVSFYIARAGYSDTIVGIACDAGVLPDISLRPLAAATTADTAGDVTKEKRIEERGLIRFFIPKRSLASSENLRLYENRLFQVSFLPWLSSEPLLTGSVSATFSLNILAGYNGAVNGIEVGGILNAVRHDVNGVQVAGYINIVGNHVTGLQSAGFMNVNLGKTDGIQLSGFSNITLDTLNGIQVAGFVNTLKGQMKGLQMAGFANVTTRDVDGLQLAGFGNFSRTRVNTAQVGGFGNYCKSVGGVQVAGFMNIATHEVNTAQIAGFMNITGDATGVQVAGFSNVATGKVTGVQVASFLNVSKKLSGVQLAVFNVSDSVSKGVPIGLLSFVTTGMHRLEIAADPGFPLQFIFKTGVPVFYNQLRFGMSFSNVYSAGYGIGSRIAGFGRFALHIDVSGDHLWSDTDSKSLGIMGNGLLSVHYRLMKYLAVYAGARMNVLITDENEEAHPDALTPGHLFSDFSRDGHRYRSWMQVNVGVSLF